MMAIRVVFAPEAADQLVEIYRCIAVNASPKTAETYTNAIVEYCEGMQLFPSGVYVAMIFDQGFASHISKNVS